MAKSVFPVFLQSGHGPYRVPAAAMTRVKTVRRPLARANCLLKILTRKQNKFGVEAEKLVLTFKGKHGAWSLIMPGPRGGN